jgi:DNA-binding CsgD family transcriptional regulator
MGRQLVRTICVAGVAVAVAFALLAILLPDGSGAGTYASASAAIALATAVAGFPAGLLAAGLSGVVVASIHLPPAGTLHIDRPEEVAGLLIFLVNGLVVAAVVSLVRRQRAVSVAGSSTPGVRPWTSAAPERPAILVEPLTDRELEVLSLVAAGRSNEGIAGSLFVSVNTVKTHLKNVYGKLGVSSRTQATARALELGLIGAPVLHEADRDEREAA